MKQYLDILRRVLEEGKEKFPTRCENGHKHVPVEGGVKTLALPNIVFSHNMEEGFPLLTTKPMAWKTMAIELEGFIKGITSKGWYKKQGCNIWNEWANPEAVKKQWNDSCEYLGDFHSMDKEEESYQKLVCDDLGPIYGYQWRSFGQHYETPDGHKPNHEEIMWPDMNGLDKETMTVKPVDQLKNIVDKLHNSPYDRRMVCSAWNPNQAHLMALPPCHFSWGVTVIGDELHLHWEQRSCDLFLGVPFNIASYALLQTLLCIEGGFYAGNLTGLLIDCHLYENQFDVAKEQLERGPNPLPTCVISYPDDREFDIFKWTHKDVEFRDYKHHPKLSKVKVVV